jgi:hypothetical protein
MSRRARRKDSEFLTQCRVLVARWKDTDPSRFGVTEAEVDQFEAKVLRAADAGDKARRARLLARARFVAQREAFGDLRHLFGALVGSVDVKARRAGAKQARGVYAAAGIDPPEKGGRRPAPAAPHGFEHTLTRGGSLIVTFQIEDQARGGLLYEVQRQLLGLEGGPSEWLPLDIVGDKRFQDDRVPPGLRQVLYRVRAMRVTGVKGPWSYPVAIPFGTMASDDRTGPSEPQTEPQTEGSAPVRHAG